MDSSLYMIIGYIRTGLLCLVFLVGVGSGVFLFIRKKTVPGILAMAGFLLFGLDTLAVLIYPLVMNTIINSAQMSIVLASNLWSCFSGLVTILGTGAIIAALLMGVLPKSKTSV